MTDYTIATVISFQKKIYMDLANSIYYYYAKSYPPNMAVRLSQCMIRQWLFVGSLTNSVLDSMATQYLNVLMLPVHHGDLILGVTTQSTRALLMQLNTVSKKECGKPITIVDGLVGER